MRPKGRSLEECLRTAPAGLPWDAVRRVFTGILRQLAADGRVPGRLHPRTILLTPAGGGVVAESAYPDPGGHPSGEPRLWEDGFDHLAPEFARSPAFAGDVRSALFSLGVCLHAALTGTPPFSPLPDAAAYLARWHAAAPPPPGCHRAAWSLLEGGESLIARWLNPDPDRRPASFAAAQAALRRLRWRNLHSTATGETYVPEARFGGGGGGDLFRGHRTRDGLPVALKITTETGREARLRREADWLRLHPHPALVRFLDWIEPARAGSGGRRGTPAVLVLEWLEGMPEGSLRRRLAAAPEGLPVPEVLTLFDRYLSAVQWLHEQSPALVHGDVKPANLYAPAGRPANAKLFDLGTVAPAAPSSAPAPGTPDYLSPEAAAAAPERRPEQADIFALGCCLYEALTGRHAYPRLPADPGAARRRRAALSPQDAAPDFTLPVFQTHPDLAAMVARAVAPAPAARYASIQAWRRDLAKLNDSPRRA